MPRFRFPRTIALALSGLILASPLMADTAIRAVTLSTAGLAMIEAEGGLGAEPLRLSIARQDIDDFLKSLMILDPEGAVAQVTLNGPGSFEDAFAHLPVTPEDVTDPARLLAAMAGAPVSVERRGESWSGTILGVSARPGEHGAIQVLSLRQEDGTIRTLEISDALSFALTDSADQAALQSALVAMRQGANPRRVSVALGSSSAAEREAGLVWLQNAPLWRTAWRAVDGPEGLRLIGWAVVENTTGMDWENVELTLATGAIRAVEARLYERVWANREVASSPQMQPAPAPMMLARPTARAVGGMAYESVAMADMATPEVMSDDGLTFSRFTLGTPVTLAAGQMISLPFLSEDLPEARLTLHRGGSGQVNPEIALALTNPLPLRLPSGVLTLYEEGRGHAGDAVIPELAPGATETVRIGRDTAVEIREEHRNEERVSELRLSRGVLVITEELERRVTYRIEGPASGERRVTIDHPRSSGWAVSAATAPEERADAWRWQVDVAEGARETLEVTERQPRLRRIAVADLDTPSLVHWQGQSLSEPLRALLGEVAAARGRIASAEQEIRNGQGVTAELEREQQRLVTLVVQLGDDSSANRERRARIDAIDGELASQRARQQVLIGEIAELREQTARLLDTEL